MTIFEYYSSVLLKRGPNIEQRFEKDSMSSFNNSNSNIGNKFT